MTESKINKESLEQREVGVRLLAAALVPKGKQGRY